MPGLEEDDNEYDTVANFYGAESPSDLKYRIFALIQGVSTGEIVIAKGKTKKKE